MPVSVLAISDTHNMFDVFCRRLLATDVHADVLVHAGDFSNSGTPGEFNAFFRQLETISHRFLHILIVPGNHDMGKKSKFEIPPNLIDRAQFLLNQRATVCGIEFFGSCLIHDDTGLTDFCKVQDVDDYKWWEPLEHSVRVLISHVPPFGKLDQLAGGQNCGSKVLASRITAAPNLSHVIFGHIHDQRGSILAPAGTTQFHNVAAVSDSLYPVSGFPFVSLTV
jgi:Icc-related predicted phosphoesterase